MRGRTVLVDEAAVRSCVTPLSAVTGKVVTLFLACGRAGPVCTHTPDVCYAGSGYEVEKPKRFQFAAATDGAFYNWDRCGLNQDPHCRGALRRDRFACR